MIESPDHWWENWPKTHAYVAEKMFFPRTVADIAQAIQRAEADQRPLRAVGGGWSFSDASIPGRVTTNRPNVRAVEAMSALVPHAQRFPTDPTVPLIANVTPMPVADAAGTMVMYDEHAKPSVVDAGWTYLGNDAWLDPQGTSWGAAASPSLLEHCADKHFRPIRALNGRCVEDADLPGTLVMFDLTESSTVPSRDWFYKGNGIWIVGITGNGSLPPTEGDLDFLADNGRLRRAGVGMRLVARAADPGESLTHLLSKSTSIRPVREPVYLMNTRSLVSSLQQNLPNIMAATALSETKPPAGRRPRHFFHVEAGITIAELGQLLAHQSPRLSLQAISGSPGATLAGALATATHGAEFNWPLLVDTVKAVHLVGPGGLEWWIEGKEQIADPQKLRAAYPGIAANRIIQGTIPVAGVAPEDWLSAAVVSLGCLGVVYSFVLEVVPLFGVREVVVQKTWQQLGFLGSTYAGTSIPALLHDSTKASDVSDRIVLVLRNGTRNGTGIPQVDAQMRPVNQYADLAINPIPRADGDFDCWIGNREMTAQLPLDSQPSDSMIGGIANAFKPDVNRKQLGRVFGIADVLSEHHIGPDVVSNIPRYRAMFNRLTRATDLVDTALDIALEPMGLHPDGPDVAQALLTGILGGLLGTGNCDRKSDVTGVSVGNLGFPASGIMGTAIEIALAPTDAFGFVQTEILDYLTRADPFYGYISIRLCSPTKGLLGMPQYSSAMNPCSVMIEVVAFANDDAREFVRKLRQRTLARIQGGLDAMLHWGLENDDLRASHLGATPALQASSNSGMSKLSTFKAVRALLHAAAPSPFHPFDSAFTERLGFSLPTDALVFADANRVVLSRWTPSAWNTPPGTPLVQSHRTYLRDVYLMNRAPWSVRVDGIRIVSSADIPATFTRPAAPAFVVETSTPFTVPFGSPAPMKPILVEFMGAPPGTTTVTGQVFVECDRPIGPTLTIDFLAVVGANGHAELQLTPDSVDVGATLVGTEVQQELTLTNYGRYAATIESMTFIDAEPPQQFSVPFVQPYSIPPGQNHTIQIVFRPTVRKLAQATLVIEMRSDTDIPSVDYHQHYEVPFVGLGLAPQLFLAPSPQYQGRRLTTLDFGTTKPGSHATASFWVRNQGDAPLIVQDVDVYRPDSFSVDVSKLPATLDPGDELEITCSCTAPNNRGLMAAGVIHVDTNDPRDLGDPSIAELTLKVTAAGPHLLNPPEALALGTDAPLTTAATLVFHSDGTAPVRIRAVRLAYPQSFAVSNHTPMKLDPGLDLTVTVTLTATAPGSYQNRLIVLHDGSPQGESSIYITGNVT